MRDLFADLREAWERMELIPWEIVDAGNPVVLLGHVGLRAWGSGIEFDSPIGSVFGVERGLVARESDFGAWDEALRAAGIATRVVSNGGSPPGRNLPIRLLHCAKCDRPAAQLRVLP